MSDITKEQLAELTEKIHERMAEFDVEGQPMFERPSPGVVREYSDFRHERAIAVRAALTNARDLCHRHYGELTGRHTDLLALDRAIDDVLSPLDSLIDILGGKAAADG